MRDNHVEATQSASIDKSWPTSAIFTKQSSLSDNWCPQSSRESTISKTYLVEQRCKNNTKWKLALLLQTASALGAPLLLWVLFWKCVNKSFELHFASKRVLILLPSSFSLNLFVEPTLEGKLSSKKMEHTFFKLIKKKLWMKCFLIYERMWVSLYFWITLVCTIKRDRRHQEKTTNNHTKFPRILAPNDLFLKKKVVEFQRKHNWAFDSIEMHFSYTVE